MGLREVLAELDVKVRGAGAVTAVNRELDRYVAALPPASAAIENLRLKQSEAAEMATRLAQRIRGLQSAEGDHAAEIEELRRAQFRATDTARGYGSQITELEAKSREAADASKAGGDATKSWGERLAAWATPQRLAVAGLAAITAAGLAVVQALRAAVDEIGAVIEQGNELANLSRRLNVSSDALQRWRFIGGQTGIEASAITSSFGALARNVESAAHGAGPAVRDFRRLGVALRDGNGALRSQEDLFRDTIRALAGVTDRTARAAIAQRIFSEGGTQLLGLIEEGPESIDRLSDRFDELGGGLSEDVVDGADEAHDALAEFDVILTSIRSSVARYVLPVVNRLLRWASDFSAGVGRAVERSSTLYIAWGALRFVGLGLEAMLVGLGRALFALAAPFLGIFVVVEDLVTAFRGGRSVIGGWVERMLAARGITMTFRGALDAAGLSWTRLEARATRTIATLLEGMTQILALSGPLGADLAASLTPTALAWRDRAGRDETAAAEADSMAAAVDTGRLFARKVAADPSIATRNRAAATAAVHSAVTYNIHGATDPEAVGRAIDARERSRLREAADTLALAAEGA